MSTDHDYSQKFTGGSFLAAAVMLWGGWMLLPVKLGTYFEVGDFAQIHEQLYFWIWTYRVHLFGIIFTAIALVALAAWLAASPARVVIWPGAAVATSGLIVSALAAAFYYHHGAWGAVSQADKTSAEIQAFVTSLVNDTEYVTCLVRFGRVFAGLGLVLVGMGLLKWRLLAAPLAWAAILLGVAAMALTMLVSDELSLFMPVFHLQSLWLAAMGVSVLRGGLHVDRIA